MARKLKPPPNKGAASLPEKVRNKMGFLKKGGKARKKTKKKGPTPTNPSLYARVKAEAKK